MNTRRYRKATLALLRSQWDALPKEHVTCAYCAAADVVTAEQVDGYMCEPCKKEAS